jgi:hypothetical protein
LARGGEQGTELVLDALEMAIWRRAGVLDGLVCHSDAGSQYTSLRYTTRLAEIGAAPSIGTVGDSYDNSLAESTIGLFKTELIRQHGPWRTLDEVELATLGYIDWFNHHRLHGEIGDIPPAELETTYYRQPEPTPRPETNRRSLYRTQAGSPRRPAGCLPASRCSGGTTCCACWAPDFALESSPVCESAGST